MLEALPAGHALPGCGPWTFAHTSAVVLGGSDRGTIVALSTNGNAERVEHMATFCEHWADVHFDAAAVGARPVASESSARRPTADAAPVPDLLVAELTLRVLDPERAPFDETVSAVRAELAPVAA